MHFNVQPLFNFWLLCGGIVAVFVVALFLLREKAGLTRRQRATLGIIRLSILALLALALLRPGVSYVTQSTPEQLIALMIDQSMSMRLPSGIDTKTRWQIAKRVGEEIAAAVPSLPPKTSLRLFTFDAQLRTDSGSSNATQSPESSESLETAISHLQEEPNGSLTDIGGPMKGVIDQSTEPPLQSIIWVSDGIQTLDSTSVNARQIARQLADSNVALYIVGVGPRSGSNESLDQWVDTVPEQIDAFAKNIVKVRALVKTIGLSNRTLNIQATLKDSKDNVVNSWNREIVPTSLAQTVPVEFPISAPSKGAYEIVVEAVAVDGEATLMNNQQTCFLNVRESGSRVLYIEGDNRSERRFILRALSDSVDLQVDDVTIVRGTMKNWPVEEYTKLFEDDTYDCIILGDIDSKALGEKTLQAIVDRVARGAGLITLGGFHAYGPGGYDATPLAQLMPVNLSGFSRQSFESPINQGMHLPGPIKMEAKRHPIFEIADNANMSDGQLQQAWRQLPEMLGANRVGELLPQPGIQVLASTPSGEPLIVASSFNLGRVLMITFDSSYLWLRHGHQDIHRRFWRQSVLWAMQSLERNPGLKITMDKRRIRAGADASYRVEWTGPNLGDPMPNGLEISIQRKEQVQPRILSPNQRDRISASGTVNSLLQADRFELVAKVTGLDGLAYEDRLPFDVVDDAIELINGAPDWQLMNQLAELNQRAGGKVIPVDQIDSLISLLQEKSKNASISLEEAHHLGEGEVDSWALLALFAILVSIQWALRKKWSLA